MPRTIPPVVLADPDDATEGMAIGVTISFFRNNRGALFFRVETPNDPDGLFEAPVPAPNRGQARSVILACLAVFKQQRNYT